MKITIQALKDGGTKLTLQFKGKSYSETWIKTDNGYSTVDECIVSRLEQDGITAENTDLEDFLTSIEVPEFMSLAEREEEW